MPGPSFPAVGSTGWGATAGTLQTYIDAAPNTAIVTKVAYGADNTGVADATTAIHAARDAGYGIVYFPPGTYKTAGLTASVAGQTWVLAPGATIQATGVAHAITIAANGVTIQGPGIVDAGSGSAFSGVFLSAGLSDVDVLGVEVINGTYGVRCKGGTGAVTNRVRVDGCTIHGQSSHGVFFNWETQDSEISSNFIYSVGGNGIWVGNTSLRCRIANNSVVTSSRNGIEVLIGSTGASIVGNTLTSIATLGISVDTSDGSRIADNRIDTVTTSYGIELAASNKCVVEGNTLKAIGTIGIQVDAASGTCDDNTIANNVVDGCGTIGINAGGSANGAKRLRVLGNEVIDPGGGSGGQPGIQNATGIGCTDWIIANNTVRWTSTTTTLASSSGINLNMPNALVIGNLIVADGTITTAGGTGINLASTALDCNVVDNTILANSKINKGILMASACTGCNVSNNRITNTLQDIINNAAASTTNQIANNVGTAAAGSGYTFGSARQFGNASTTSSVNFSFSSTTGTTAPGAGAAGALPATPAGYVTVVISGTARQIPYY